MAKAIRLWHFAKINETRKTFKAAFWVILASSSLIGAVVGALGFLFTS